MWICPNCQETIEKLLYSVPTISTEYGNAFLSDCEEKNSSDKVAEHNYSDSGDVDWDGSVEYECPECNENVYLSDLTWEDEDNEEEEEEEEKEEEGEEEKCTIHKPKINILSKENGKDISNAAILCKNPKCKKIIVFQKKNNFDEDFFECPKCGTINSK